MKITFGVIGFIILVIISLVLFIEASRVPGHSLAGGLGLIAAAIALHRKD